MAIDQDNAIEVRAGSEDYITFTLKADDIAIDLTSANKITLFLKNVTLDTIAEYATDDGSPKLFIFGIASNGQVQFKPDDTTFSNGDYFSGYFVIEDGDNRDIPIPEDSEFHIKIRDKFA